MSKVIVHIIKIAFYLLILISTRSFCCAQTANIDRDTTSTLNYHLYDVNNNVQEFYNSITTLIDRIGNSLPQELDDIKYQYDKLEIKWGLYYPQILDDISNNDQLLSIVVAYNNITNSFSDSLTLRKEFLESKANFESAALKLKPYIAKYKGYLVDSDKLSTTNKLAPLLDKLKVEESLSYLEVTELYNNISNIKNKFPEFSRKFDIIEQQYITISTYSQQIQNAKYIPFIDRIKEYLYSIAAVSIIVMLLSMVQSKISALKAAKKSTQNMKKIFNKDNEYPTI